MPVSGKEGRIKSSSETFSPRSMASPVSCSLHPGRALQKGARKARRSSGAVGQSPPLHGKPQSGGPPHPRHAPPDGRAPCPCIERRRVRRSLPPGYRPVPAGPARYRPRRCGREGREARHPAAAWRALRRSEAAAHGAPGPVRGRRGHSRGPGARCRPAAHHRGRCRETSAHPG